MNISGRVAFIIVVFLFLLLIFQPLGHIASGLIVIAGVNWVAIESDEINAKTMMPMFWRLTKTTISVVAVIIIIHRHFNS